MNNDIMRAIPVFVVHLEDPKGSGRAACTGLLFESVYGKARPGDTLWMCTGCYNYSFTKKENRNTPESRLGAVIDKLEEES